jgi:hypothetical protein
MALTRRSVGVVTESRCTWLTVDAGGAVIAYGSALVDHSV